MTIDFDALEAALAVEGVPVDMPVTHRFTPGLYIREIFMPKGAKVLSLVHKTTHPFTILEGDVSVFSENEQVQRYTTGHLGITTPGTRRMLSVHEDTRWATFHVTEDTDPDTIVQKVTEPHCNRYLGSDDPRLQAWRQNPPALQQ